MRIGINALCVGNRSGTGRYTAQLLAALAELPEAAAHEFHVCLPEGSPLEATLADRPNFHLRPVRLEGPLGRFVRADGPLRRLWFERLHLVSWIVERRLDLFHGPAFVLPARCPVPAVVTLHDLVFELFPETVPRTRRALYRREIPRSVRQARLVLCDSESTARDAREHLGIPAERLRTVHLGVEERFFQAPDAAVVRAVREALDLPDRFWLTVGTLEPRKNIPGLLEAYARVSAERPDVPPLVIAGRQGWGLRDLRRIIARHGLAERVRLTGFVAEAHLPALYGLSELFIHASLYEGFGLPVLEAMAAGTPVIAGDHSSIPEVVGDTARLVDTRDARAMAEALAAFAAAPGAARELAGRARRRAAWFSWSAAARRTVRVYEEAAGIPSSTIGSSLPS